MPDIAVLHPQLAHFVIALTIFGVLFRLVSLTGRLRFLNPAASILIIAAALFSVFSVTSGDQAHGPVERIPGAEEPLVEHEEWGERTRNLLLALAAFEVVSLAFSGSQRRERFTKAIRYSSAVLGLLAIFFVYETGEHGGELVYGFGGGVGTRIGEPEHVQNALIAGLYNAAMQDRQAGRGEEAARLFAELERRRPNDQSVRLFVIESTLRDRKDPAAALAALRGFAPGDNRNLQARVGLLKVDAFQASGQADSARALMAQLQKDFPNNGRVQRRAQELQSGR